MERISLRFVLFSILTWSVIAYAQNDPQGNLDYFHIVCGGQGYNGTGQNEICLQILFWTDNFSPHQLKRVGTDLIIAGNNLVAIDTTVSKAFSGSNYTHWDSFTVMKADNPDPTALPFHMHYGTAYTSADWLGQGNWAFAKICLLIDDTGTICIDTLSISPLNNTVTTASGFTFTPGWGGTSGSGYPSGIGVCCAAGLCTAIPGDADASGTLTLVDIIRTINYIFVIPYCIGDPLACLSGLLCRGDWNGNGSVALNDVIYGVNYIFDRPGGPWTPKPSGSCCQPVP